MSQQKVESPLFQQGLKDGLPICLGYISVAFTFGMMATEGGLAPWSSLLISMTNLTSAGQFAGTALILSGGTLLEIAVTTFVINIRYMLMSLSLSQKLDPDMKMAEVPVVHAEPVRQQPHRAVHRPRVHVDAAQYSGCIS